MQQRLHTSSSLGSGFTLLELMLVLGLIGLLAVLVQPIYVDYVQRGQQLRAQAILLSCAQRIQRLSLHQFDYLGHADSNGDGIGDADQGSLAVSACPDVDAVNVSYAFSIVAFADGFELRAIPEPSGQNAGRGALSLDHTGLRRWDTDDNGEFAADELQWSVG